MRISKEKPPLSLVLNNTSVSSPPINRVKNLALVGIRTVDVLGSSVDKEVRVAGRVHEVVQLAALVNPGSLEESTLVVLSLKRFACLGGENDEIAGRFGDLVHVLAELGDLGRQGVGAVGSSLVSDPRLVEVLLVLPGLELAAPDTAPDEIGLVVSVDIASGIDTVCAGDPALVGLERAAGLVGDSNSNSEDLILVLGREVEIIFAVLVSCIRSPHLLLGPGNVID